MVENNNNTEQANNESTDFKLVGFSNFVRSNPKSDRFRFKKFHHIEFWCTDATNSAHRFSWGLGMPIVAKSDLSTGNSIHASYVIRTGELNFLFTAPYSTTTADPSSKPAIPTFDHSLARSFCAKHGLAVRAIAVEVEDAESAFHISVSNGAKATTSPVKLDDNVVLSEVHLYGDVVLRYLSFKAPNKIFLPGFETNEISSYQDLDFGIRRVDHVVGNVPSLPEVVSYVKNFTGFHEFAEFTSEDVGTSESGLNSVVLSSNDEMVLLPINEPVYGTKRKSQIQTFLEHNEGAGVQHLALMCEDIFTTLKEMKSRTAVGGFEFMPPPPPTYYKNLRERADDILSEEMMNECEELGILVDRDPQGTLLQIFTKPLGDRPTIFIEIIQRVGCMLVDDEGKPFQKGGCGGFGKGNFAELFKSIEEYEKTLEAKASLRAAA